MNRVAQQKLYWRKYKKRFGKRPSYVRTKKHKKLMSKLKKGKTYGEEWRKKISLNHADVSGKNNPMYGKRGELHPSWKGGGSIENDILRKSFKFRDC